MLPLSKFKAISSLFAYNMLRKQLTVHRRSLVSIEFDIVFCICVRVRPSIRTWDAMHIALVIADDETQCLFVTIDFEMHSG